MGSRPWFLAPPLLVVLFSFAHGGQPLLAAGVQPAEPGAATQPAQQVIGKETAVSRETLKNLQSDRVRKTLKIYKSLRPAEAAKLIDRLDETTATAILNSLDQKTVTNLIPFLNQSRVLKWTRETMAGR